MNVEHRTLNIEHRMGKDRRQRSEVRGREETDVRSQKSERDKGLTSDVGDQEGKAPV